MDTPVPLFKLGDTVEFKDPKHRHFQKHPWCVSRIEITHRMGEALCSFDVQGSTPDVNYGLIWHDPATGTSAWENHLQLHKPVEERVKLKQIISTMLVVDDTDTIEADENIVQYQLFHNGNLIWVVGSESAIDTDERCAFVGIQRILQQNLPLEARERELYSFLLGRYPEKLGVAHHLGLV